ncbi:hypothetical protein [Prosthecobacter sp.]|uniref:hypothetical protein n=1 Tax=Prosthecobacter sp. TaxID=1965333 RepID=UPI001D893435|nr:hypothetical protein [Prosthecobacter sp.]MCB1277230.1 hypothetical protein [Prosthecobacter sp.]
MEQSHLDRVSALELEIREWALGIRCLFAVLNVLPLYYCTRVLLAAPRFETIFEDMLGSKQKLPVLTRLVLQNSMSLLAVAWLMALAAITMIFTLKQGRHVWVSAVVSAAVLILSGHLVATVLVDPLVTIIANLSGGSGIP